MSDSEPPPPRTVALDELSLVPHASTPPLAPENEIPVVVVARVAGTVAPGFGRSEVGGRARDEVGGRAGRKDVDGIEGPNDSGGTIAGKVEEAMWRRLEFFTRFAPSSLIKMVAFKKTCSTMRTLFFFFSLLCFFCPTPCGQSQR
jgi:hypothetical protein